MTSTNKENSPFGRAISALYDLTGFVDVRMAGISFVQFRPELEKFVSTTEQKQLKDSSELSSVVQSNQQFAQRQFEQGFPYLFGFAALRLYSILEIFVEDFVLRLIENNQSIGEMPIIRKLQGPLVEFLQSSSARRAELLFNLLISDLNVPLKAGVGRYEAVFNAIGLGGPVDEGVKKVLLELSEVRNVIAHRNGIIDAKFLRNCPWFKANLGDTIRQTHLQFRTYFNAILWYFYKIHRRENIVYPTEETAKGVSVEELVAAQERQIQRIRSTIVTREPDN
ncbi:hypothetical protein [Sulfuricaulis sp.]|jgi:hypothetical protein|uniref:hypothetical protein n=1 Tax=Sulfuricaulis sp. TaxID=2003553 RepID=UPI0035596885